ncbi:MAG TPA: hypothetical protein VK666_28125 [Chryseolinea sp.]|nr:hypothetical protein [Chryseolinea sp.]
MKKYIARTALVLVATAILFSCKKDSPKDYTASVAETTWWGKFAYAGKSSQYYSVHFAANGSFTWSEMAGDLTGHWTVDGRHLSITLGATGKEIKAEISEDGKLNNIENNSANGYTIASGELIANPNTSSLDNTLWKGSYTTGPGVGMTTAVNFRFLPALKFQMEFVSVTLSPYAYTRSASGVVIRGPYYIFGVVISETEMKGTDSANLYDWQLTKNP